VRTETSVEHVSRQGEDGPVTVRLDDGSELVGDELLVAAGRVFSTDDIGLETVGLESGRPLEVDDQLRVTAVDGNWLYAAGDVTGVRC
jgi:pyruvate/2-oxoglutarate dehydrogenase complex dihydrolipoamide dehydrogenase (E3) component